MMRAITASGRVDGRRGSVRVGLWRVWTVVWLTSLAVPAVAQEAPAPKAEGFIERIMSPAAYPQLAEGRLAVAEFEQDVRRLDHQFNRKFQAAVEKLHEAVSKARETAIEEGHPDEAARLLAFEVDLPKPGFVERRHVWEHSAGHFEKLFNGLWIEFIGSGAYALFEESQRTPQHIELSRITPLNANIRVRLEKKRGLVKFGSKPYEHIYNGRWVQNPSMRNARDRERKKEEAVRRIREWQQRGR